MKIAVIGHGWVGGTVARWFKDCIIHDPPKGIFGDVASADVCFVCVPTPFGDNGFDDSYVRSAVAAIPGNKIVVIKSTVLPGTTERIAAVNPHHVVMFNPEFLRERACDEDFRKPDRQIIGCDAQHAADAERIMSILPSAPHEMIMRTRDAEMVKYFGNCYLSMRITFGNQLYDLCQAVGADYETVKGAAELDHRIGAGYFEVMTDGYRGYGGTCFPKDMRALIQLGDAAGSPQEVLRACESVNNELRKAVK